MFLLQDAQSFNFAYSSRIANLPYFASCWGHIINEMQQMKQVLLIYYVTNSLKKVLFQLVVQKLIFAYHWLN